MADFIVAGVLLAAVGAAIVYIIRAKKRGVKCVGCPSGGHCPARNSGHAECTCGCHQDTD